MIVAAFPGQEGLGRWCESVEGGAAPEFFFIHPVTAFDLSILLGAPGFDIAEPHPCLLHRECKGQWEFGAVVHLQFSDGKGECRLDGRQERVAGLLILLRIETEDPIAGTVINGGVLETFGASDFDFFDIHLNTIARPFAAEEGKLPRTPLRLSAEGRIPQSTTDPLNRRGRDPNPMHALKPDAGADRPEVELSPRLLYQGHSRVRDAAWPDRGIARNETRETHCLPTASPDADGLAIQAKPPGGSLDSMFSCILHNSQTALDGMVMAFRDLLCGQFLSGDGWHMIPPSNGLTLAQWRGPFSTRYFNTEECDVGTVGCTYGCFGSAGPS